MRTVRTKIYKFEELSKEGQQLAINFNQDINVSFDWWWSTYEDAENIGLKITGFELDRDKRATGILLNDAYAVAVDICANHGEECSTFKLATEFIQFWNEAVKMFSDGVNSDKVLNEKAEEFDDYVNGREEQFLKDLLSCYADILQNECEYLQSDEAIKETLIFNEYEFTKDGNIFNS